MSASVGAETDSTRTKPAPSTPGSAGRVIHGTCGWSDASIVSCGRFYPKSVKTAADKLAVYSKTFGCVEVDSSCYAIPPPDNVAKWVAQVPKGFMFHFKAFGLFCAQGCPANAIPRGVRNSLSAEHASAAQVKLHSLSDDAVAAIWARFHAAIEPAQAAGKLGCVMFQFHLSFAPTQASRAHVEWCREKLRQDVAMAVEFRNRAWFKEAGALAETQAWLSKLGIALIAADELEHETQQPDRNQTGLQAGLEGKLMHIALAVTNPQFTYIRVHRRFGTHERILAQSEHDAWVRRLMQLQPKLQGPIFFLWGTDWEDAPVVNAARLQAVLPAQLHFDWKAHVKAVASTQRGSLAAMFASPQKRSLPSSTCCAERVQASEATCSEGATAAATEATAIAQGSGQLDTPLLPHETVHPPHGATSASDEQQLVDGCSKPPEAQQQRIKLQSSAEANSAPTSSPAKARKLSQSGLHAFFGKR